MINITLIAQNNTGPTLSETLPIEKVIIEIDNKNKNGFIIGISKELERLKSEL